MPCTVRPATLADAATIIDFNRLLAQESEGKALDPELLAPGVRAGLIDSNKGRYFIAEDAGAIAGQMGITYEWSDWRNGMVWWIQSVYVIPEARKQGLYAGLYEHIKNLVRADESVRGIRLYVDQRNTAAQQVYSRLGMNGEHYQVFEWMKDF